MITRRVDRACFARALRFTLRYYANLWLLLILQLSFFYIDDGPPSTEAPGLWAVAVSVVCVVTLVNLALARLRSRWLAAALNLAFVGFYTALVMYHWRRGAPVDFALVASHAGDLLTAFGWRGLREGGGVAGWGLVAGATAGVVTLEARFRSLSTFHRFERPRTVAVGLLLMVAACIAMRVPNELLLFMRSTGHYALYPFEAAMRHVDSPEPYPLYRPATPSQRPPTYAPNERPHIVIVLMESFSTDYVERRDRLGREITPYFDALVSRGAYHELFFANSMQTERGHVATLCSLIPSFRRKVMTAFYDDRFICLAEILRSVGYETTWAQAVDDLSYDNVGGFMKRNGFDHVIAMDERFVSDDERKYVWGWGLQDDHFYRKTVAFLSEKDPTRPQLAVLATTGNHAAFNTMPAEGRSMFPEPSSFEEDYINSIHFADAHLAALFEALGESPLSNSLVILLGDHGFPIGQHGVTSNEVSFYNELFRVPLLVLGPGVEPFRNADIAYSQLDIAPALMEWLGISHANAFAGVPIPFRATDLPTEQHFIPLIQPYDGGYLMSVRYPFKYVRHLSTDNVQIFDLAADPLEARDLADQLGPGGPVPKLADDVTRIFLNQRLLDEDRFIPR